jgi:hypothetical protein
MSILPAQRAPSQPKPPRKPPAGPRQPIGWNWNAERLELTITDCDGKAETYRVLTLHTDFGRGFELVNVGRRFGTFYHVHFDGPAPSCTCPGGTHRGVCKHITAVAALVVGGAL